MNALSGKSLTGLARPVSSRSARYTSTPLQNRPSGPLRRNAPITTAFIATKQAASVKLPIDFYALLQINPGVSRESVSRAYERYAIFLPKKQNCPARLPDSNKITDPLN